MPIALIVHGGSWSIPDHRVEAHRSGCIQALAAGWSVLAAGGTAMHACEAAVRVLEDDPTFNAGTGSVLNCQGNVELDAAIMEGRTLSYGAVASLQHIRNPITLARLVLNGPATLLVGSGAEAFAVESGMSLCDNADLVIEREQSAWQRRQARRRSAEQSQAEVGWSGSVASPQVPAADNPSRGHDTVGAIALDRSGGLVAASSTGGTPFKLPGRVGDTPLVGAGLYADAARGACVCTGDGEAITRMALARRAIELLEHGISPHVAARYAVSLLSRRVPGSQAGCALLSSSGQIGLAWNARRMAYAYRVEGGDVVCGV